MTLLFRGRSSNIPRYLPRTTRAASLLCILMRTAPLGPLRTDLGCRPRLDGARRFALGHAKLLSRASAQQRAGGLAQQRAATTQTPRRPIGAGGVRGASRSGSASVITTHALFARKVQRKLSNGVAGFAAGGSSSERKRSRPIRAFSATPNDGQRPCRTLAEDPRQNPAPSCLSPALQLKREWSPWPQ